MQLPPETVMQGLCSKFGMCVGGVDFPKSPVRESFVTAFGQVRPERSDIEF